MVSRSFIPVLAVGFLLGAGPVLLSGCTSGESSEVDQLEPVTVRVAPVIAEAEAKPLRFAGMVQPRERAVLTFQVSGTLESRPVKLGQAVEEGALLARVYNPQLAPARDSAKARLRELQSQAEQATRELARAEKLHERGVQSVQGLEQARAAEESLAASVETARAALAEAQQMVAETAMRAPFAGRIENLSVEPGEFVSVGQPVLSLSSAEGMEVEIQVPENLLMDFRPGDELPVWLVRRRDAGRIPARIAEIAQASGDAGKLQTVVVHLEDPPSSETLIARAQAVEGPGTAPLAAVPVAGTPVEVGIPARNRHALSVPMLAVMRSGNGAAVFRVQQNRVQRVPVNVVRLQGESVLVRSTLLEPDDAVVYAGLSRLADGDKVEVLP
jgi:RND family efflux transporter MFP subunit